MINYTPLAKSNYAPIGQKNSRRPSLRLFENPSEISIDIHKGEHNGPSATTIELQRASSVACVAATLGRRGATVPQGGDEAPLLPSQDIICQTPAGSSTVKRWSLLARIQRLCRPSEEGKRGPAVVGCGMPGHTGINVNIHLRTSVHNGEIKAGVSGVHRCKSPWLCPVCSVGKAYERAQRVERAASATFNRGGAAALVVLTAAHSRETSLKDIKAIVQGASSASRKGRAWIKAINDYGILGVIVGQEVTFSTINGWHYHQHLSVLVDGPADNKNGIGVAERAKMAGEWIAHAYATQVRQKGGTVSNRNGWHVRIAIDANDASHYTAKGSMAWEVSGAHKDDTKMATSMTPWDIAISASNGDRLMRAKWQEYTNTMPGTRSCVVSASLASKLGIDTDTENAENTGEQVLHESDEIVGRVDTSIWKKWFRHGLLATFLSRVEFGGEEGFDKAVDDTEKDAEPLVENYRKKIVQRIRNKELLAIAYAKDQSDKETEAAYEWARRRLQHYGQFAGSRQLLYFTIEQAVIAFPNARALKANDLVKYLA